MTKARDLANASTALSAVSPTELGYLDGVTSAVQTQLDAKLASSTAATTYQAINTNVSTTELGYLDGVTSAIQTQLNNKFSTNGGVIDGGANSSIEIVGTSNAFIDFKNSAAEDYDARLINTSGAAGLVIATASTMTTGATLRNITMSTSDPSGGSDGDVWIKYT